MRVHNSCRIVVTGIGLCTPLGPDRESSWRGLVSGRSGIRWLSAPQWSDVVPMAGAPVCLPDHRPFRHSEPLVELALTTAAESLTDAGLNPETLHKRSVGIVFGTSKGGLHTFSRLFEEFRKNANNKILSLIQNNNGLSPLHESRKDAKQDISPIATNIESNDWLNVFPNQPAAAIRRFIGGEGPLLCPVAACATGLAACLRGAELIQNGDCDLVLAGSADTSIQPALLGSFRRLGVLSRETQDAAVACRPFDLHRSGFVIGEGAACLVLERMDSALNRRAKCYAEWLGGRMLSDPYGLTQLDPEGSSLERLLQDLGSLYSRSPDYINLHGTGTATNDPLECRTIHHVFGDSTNQIDCSSLKGGLGHLLGAAGSVELAATALAIRDQIVPPTVNLRVPDPECQLNLTAGIAKRRDIKTAWKLSMGFGGHIAGACLGKIDRTG